VRPIVVSPVRLPRPVSNRQAVHPTALSGIAFAAVLVFAVGCGKKSEEAKPAAKSVDKASNAKAPEAKPKPPSLGMDEAKFANARLIEACALKAGESKQDALTLAINSLAGLPHVAPPKALAKAAKAAPKPEKTGKPTKAKKSAKGAAKAKNKGVPKPPVAPGAPDSEEPTSAASDADGDGGQGITPAGRPALTPQSDKFVAQYASALKVLPKRPDISKPLADKVDKCRWSPQLGVVADELVKRYVEAFVKISCLQITMRDKSGKTDGFAHAQEATKVFRANGFTAKRFSTIGVALAAFGDITSQVHTLRRERCADPLELAQAKLSEGEFIGSFAGRVSGTLAFTGANGAAKGSIKHGAGKLKSSKSWQLTGAVSGSHVHLFAREGSDWLRFDGVPKSGAGKGKFDGEVGFKSVSGTWRWARRPPPKPTKPTK
jgi:hypothetical protein